MGCIMGIQRLEWVSPSPSSITLTLILAFILIGGQIQAYAFVDDVPGIEPPPLYDLLRPLSIWPAMAILVLPWSLMGSILCLTGVCGVGGLSTIFLLVVTYLEASWFVRVWRGLTRTGRSIIVISSIAPWIPSLPAVPRDPLFFVSSTVLGSTVVAVHLTSSYGLLKVLYRLVRKGRGVQYPLSTPSRGRGSA